MKQYLCLLLVCAFAALPSSFSKATGEGGCIYDGQTYKVGGYWTPAGHCSRITCTGPAVTSHMTCATPMFTDRRCSMIPGDSSKPYPDCCDKSYCPPEVYQHGQ